MGKWSFEMLDKKLNTKQPMAMDIFLRMLNHEALSMIII